MGEPATGKNAADPEEPVVVTAVAAGRARAPGTNEAPIGADVIGPASTNEIVEAEEEGPDIEFRASKGVAGTSICMALRPTLSTEGGEEQAVISPAAAPSTTPASVPSPHAVRVMPLDRSKGQAVVLWSLWHPLTWHWWLLKQVDPSAHVPVLW